MRYISSAMKQPCCTKPPRKKDQEKTLLERCTPESPVYTGVSGPVHRSLRTILRSDPRNQAGDSQKAPPETGPEIDRSLQPRPESLDFLTPGMSRPFGPGPCNPQFRLNFQFYPE